MIIINKLFNILRYEVSPSQISLSLILGMFLGFLHLSNLLSLFIIMLILLLNVNISISLIGLIIFWLLSILFNSLFHNIGYALLVDATLLKGFWTLLYNLPIVPLTKFNNTIVMGGLVFSIVFTIPVFILSRFVVIKYRKNLEK